MTSLDEARDLDAADERVAAAKKYEEALRTGDDGLAALLDLAVLYFTLLDPGEAAAHHVGREFLDQAWERANELLREAEERFGRNSEIDFWRRYFAFIVLGEEPFVADCRRIANSDESLVPFFYLWSESGGDEYRKEAEALYKRVSAGRTARERYVRSMVAGVSRGGSA
jgi:hypothetical protein